MGRVRRFVFMALLAVAPGAVSAQGEALEVAPGSRVTLPLSGLSVEFPADAGDLRLLLRGSWSSAQDYDARDVIDAFKGDTLVAGTWVQTGYFTAGGAKQAVEAVQFVDGSPTTTFEAWGLTWHARAGRFDLSESLGLQPSVVLGADRGTDQPSMYLQHFFNGEGKLPAAEMIRRVRESRLIAGIAKAYRQQQWGASKPMQAATVRARNNSSAVRAVVLPKFGMTVQLPDDGYFWQRNEKAEGPTEMLWRLAPTFPEVTLDVLVVDVASIDAAWQSMGLSRPSGATMANLPDGWEVGPEVQPSNGKETTVARQIGGKVLIVGFMANTVTVDAQPFRPMLEALARSVGSQ